MTIIADSFHDLTYSTVSEALDPIKNVVVFPQHFDKIQILFHSLPPERQVVALAYKLRKILLKFTDANFNIGIGRCRTSPDELWASAEESHRAASSGALLGQNSVIHIGYIDPDKSTYVYPHHKQKRMLSCTLSGNCKEALRMLDEIFDALKKAAKLPQSLINKIALGIFVDLNIAAVSKARAFEKIQMDAVSIGDLINAKSIQDVHSFLKNTIEHFATEMADLMSVKSDILFVRLEKYVLTHPNFDLDDMVRHFKTTVQSLNTSVYNNTGGSIFDYVQVRE